MGNTTTTYPHTSPERSAPAPCKALSWIWARTVVFRLWDWFPLMLATSRPGVWLPEHLFLISVATCFLVFHFKFTYKYPLRHRSITTADHKHQELPTLPCEVQAGIRPCIEGTVKGGLGCSSTWAQWAALTAKSRYLLQLPRAAAAPFSA